MLHYIIKRCGEKENVGQKVLCKLCYFSDFDHYERTFKSITGKSYCKAPHGPIPFSYEESFDSLEKEGMITAEKKQFDGYKQYRYRSLTDPDMSDFLPEEIMSIESAIERYGDMTGGEIEEISHMDVPWMIARDGEPIDYGAAMYRDPCTSVDAGQDDEDGE